MDPMVTSSLISAGTNLLGGLFGGKKKQPDPLTQFREMQGEANRYALDYTTKYPSAAAYGFKEAGIHPIYGFGSGAAMGSMPGISTSGGNTDTDSFNTMQSVGQGLSRVAHAYLSREEREATKTAAALTLENQKLQNDRLKAEIALMTQPGSPPGLSYGSAIPGQPDSRYPMRDKLPLGVDSAAPLWKLARDQKGNPMRVYNSTELGDSEFLQTLGAIGVTLPDWIHGNIGKPAADKLSKFWHFIASKPHYRYNPK
nr:MAG: DNA pilot protein [Microvirus sp.]